MHPKNILLVEDEQLVREKLKRLLSRDQHQVVESNNGAEAFILFKRSEFDLVVLDYDIPFVKGDELAGRIKQIAPNQPILMVSDYRRRLGPDLPVDAILHKACDSKRLLEVVDDLLSRSHEEWAKEDAPLSPALSP